MDPATIATMANTGAQFLGSVLGGSGRTSHEHFIENETRADWSNTNQIARENEFLSGVTANRAQNYNAYQDQTYGQDTQREIDRTKATAQQLGMSPWELKGQSSGPLVSPGGSDTNNPTSKGSDFLAASVPLKTAEIQARTSLANTAMQSQTQKDIASQQTAGGQGPKNQAALSAAQAATEAWRTVSEQKNARLTELRALREKVNTLKDLLPTEQIDAGPYKRFSTTNWQKLLQSTQDDAMFGSEWNNLTSDSKESMLKDLTDLTNMGFQGAKQAVQGSGDLLETASQFLGGLIPKNK